MDTLLARNLAAPPYSSGRRIQAPNIDHGRAVVRVKSRRFQALAFGLRLQSCHKNAKTDHEISQKTEAAPSAGAGALRPQAQAAAQAMQTDFEAWKRNTAPAWDLVGGPT